MNKIMKVLQGDFKSDKREALFDLSTMLFMVAIGITVLTYLV